MTGMFCHLHCNVSFAHSSVFQVSMELERQLCIPQPWQFSVTLQMVPHRPLPGWAKVLCMTLEDSVSRERYRNICSAAAFAYTVVSDESSSDNVCRKQKCLFIELNASSVVIHMDTDYHGRRPNGIQGPLQNNSIAT